MREWLAQQPASTPGPTLFITFTEDVPLSSSARTHSSRPRAEATNKGVLPTCEARV